MIKDENEVYDIYIKNLNQETVATIKSNEGKTRTIEVVKENIQKFTTKNIKLIKGSEGKIFVESVKWDSWDSPILSHKNSRKMSNNVKDKFWQKMWDKIGLSQLSQRG